MLETAQKSQDVSRIVLKALYDQNDSIDDVHEGLYRIILGLEGMKGCTAYYYYFLTLLLVRSGYEADDIVEFWRQIDSGDTFDTFLPKIPAINGDVSHYEVGGDTLRKFGDKFGARFGGQLSGYSYMSDIGGYKGGNGVLLGLGNAVEMIPEKVDVISAAKVFENGSGCHDLIPRGEIMNDPSLSKRHYFACRELLAAIVNRLKDGGYVLVENHISLEPDLLKFLGLTVCADNFKMPYTERLGKQYVGVTVFKYTASERQLDQSFHYYNNNYFAWSGDQVVAY